MYTSRYARLRAVLILLILTPLTGCNFGASEQPQPADPDATEPAPDGGDDAAPSSTPPPDTTEPEPGEPVPPMPPPPTTDIDEPSPTPPITLFDLRIEILGDGSVEPAGGSFEPGTALTLIATPAGGWRFDGWSGDVASEQPTLEVTIDSHLAIRASFVQQFVLTLEIDGNGTVEIDPSDGPYDTGTVVGLTAVAGTGSQFDRWEGDLDSLNSSEAITLDADKLVTAVFDIVPAGGGGGGGTPPVVETVLFTVATIGDGTVDINPAGTPTVVPDGLGFLFPLGTQISLTAVDSAGGCFFRWGGDLGENDATVQVTLSEETFVLAEFADVLAPPSAPALDEHVTHTDATLVTITGSVPACQNDAAGIVEIISPLARSMHRSWTALSLRMCRWVRIERTSSSSRLYPQQAYAGFRRRPSSLRTASRQRCSSTSRPTARK